ncbi:MAG: cytochrome c [Chromatiaceae bacterium]|nr:cytochrome c [Chromatiaceae bacterium]
MKAIFASTSAALLTAALASSAVVAADLKPEDQIRYRQAGYSFMAWNMGKIKANLDGQYNAEQVSAAANAIDAIAKSGMGALYGPGTDQNIGEVKTRVKPELFSNMQEVGTLARDFAAATDNLAKVAMSGDAAEVRGAFGAVGKACKSCHDKFRAD